MKVNLFLAGPGSVGSAFLKLLRDKKNIVEERTGIQFSLNGLINSQKMIFDENEIPLEEWREKLVTSLNPNYAEGFVDRLINIDLTDKIFIDSTAEDLFTQYYPKLLEKGIHVVTPNKIANTKSYSFYLALRKAADAGLTKFMYSTNVGAGLPILEILKDMVRAGDEIFSIEGIFSGTLSYIFNSLTPENRFSEIVKSAYDKSFTEPFPGDDLTGLDMGRKLLIMIREIGYALELEDIKIQPLISEKFYENRDADLFLKSLEEVDQKFFELQSDAYKNKSRIMYIATFNAGETPEIKLKTIHTTDPFYRLSYNQNIFRIKSESYNNQPLVLTGRGAGVRFTAWGMLNDILRIFK